MQEVQKGGFIVDINQVIRSCLCKERGWSWTEDDDWLQLTLKRRAQWRRV